MFFNKHISFTCCSSQTPAVFTAYSSLCHTMESSAVNPIFYKIEKWRESMSPNWIFNGFSSVVCAFFSGVRSCFPVVYLLLYAKLLDRASQNGVLYGVRNACVCVCAWVFVCVIHTSLYAVFVNREKERHWTTVYTSYKAIIMLYNWLIFLFVKM